MPPHHPHPSFHPFLWELLPLIIMPGSIPGWGKEELTLHQARLFIIPQNVIEFNPGHSAEYCKILLADFNDIT